MTKETKKALTEKVLSLLSRLDAVSFEVEAIAEAVDELGELIDDIEV
jgi:hypothetical protein